MSRLDLSIARRIGLLSSFFASGDGVLDGERFQGCIACFCASMDAVLSCIRAAMVQWSTQSMMGALNDWFHSITLLCLFDTSLLCSFSPSVLCSLDTGCSVLVSAIIVRIIRRMFSTTLLRRRGVLSMSLVTKSPSIPHTCHSLIPLSSPPSMPNSLHASTSPYPHAPAFPKSRSPSVPFLSPLNSKQVFTFSMYTAYSLWPAGTRGRAARLCAEE